MKVSDIEIGKAYAYQRNRSESDRLHGIQQAIVTGFTTSHGGSKMIKIELTDNRWEYDYDDKYNRIPDSGRRVDYKISTEVTAMTIVGDWETESARRQAWEIQDKADQEEREIARQAHKAIHDPAMNELRKAIQRVTGRYVSEYDRIGSLPTEALIAITEALNAKESVSA